MFLFIFNVFLNFIVKDTVEHFYNLKHLNFTGPMLKLTPSHMYANFHNKATDWGYFAENDQYIPILNRKVSYTLLLL
tara:strand:+ start:528 stop:758 length:231 start_codon:yes stop_codon:yes gene_type:complete